MSCSFYKLYLQPKIIRTRIKLIFQDAVTRFPVFNCRPTKLKMMVLLDLPFVGLFIIGYYAYIISRFSVARSSNSVDNLKRAGLRKFHTFRNALFSGQYTFPVGFPLVQLCIATYLLQLLIYPEVHLEGGFK